MTTQFSSDELHHFKTAVLAERRGKDLSSEGLPAIDFGNTDESGKTSDNPKGANTEGLREEYMQVNFVKHLITFFSLMAEDNRLKANHISLYIAIFFTWNDLRFPKQFPINREEMMRDSKIGSANTYTDCLKWLHKCGYIIYCPSGRPYIPCQVSIVPLTGISLRDLKNDTRACIKSDIHTRHKNDTRTRPEKDTHTCIKSEPGTVANLRRIYNNKQTNIKTESKQVLSQKKLIIDEKEIPTMEAATDWFTQRGQTIQEARKFFYHYQAIGWTFGRYPITDWQSLAAKWTENIKTITYDKPGRLHVDKNKSYSEPL